MAKLEATEEQIDVLVENIDGYLADIAEQESVYFRLEHNDKEWVRDYVRSFLTMIQNDDQE